MASDICLRSSPTGTDHTWGHYQCWLGVCPVFSETRNYINNTNNNNLVHWSHLNHFIPQLALLFHSLPPEKTQLLQNRRTLDHTYIILCTFCKLIFFFYIYIYTYLNFPPCLTVVMVTCSTFTKYNDMQTYRHLVRYKRSRRPLSCMLTGI